MTKTIILFENQIDQSVLNLATVKKWQLNNLFLYVLEVYPTEILNSTGLLINYQLVSLKLFKNIQVFILSSIQYLISDVLLNFVRLNSIRKDKDVGLTHNYMFSCKSPNALLRILQSIKQSRSYVEFISILLKCKYMQHEILEIKFTADQIKKLIQ